MPVMRIPRDRRRGSKRVVLMERDDVLMPALGRFRIARTSDLVTIAFDGIRRDTAAARLRRLYDAGFLEVVQAERTSENIYALGPLGRRRLTDRGLPTGHAPSGGHQHHL